MVAAEQTMPTESPGVMGTDKAPVEAVTRAKLETALRDLNRGEYADAEGLLLPLAALSNPDALQLLGIMRGMQGRDSEAEDYYRRSLALNPEQPQVHHNLGNLLRSQGRLDEAFTALREAIRLKPNYAEAHLSLALANSARGDHVEAEKNCREALRLQPNYVLAKQCLAAELNELDRPAEAERLLRRALTLGVRDPAQVAALEHNLGVSLNMQRRHREALGFFEAAQQKVPELPLVNYNRGIALQHVGRLEEAVASYKRAIMSNPLNMLAHRDLNQLLYRLGDDAEFLSSYDEVAALYPEVGAIYFDKGNFLFLQERFELAREVFERAVRLLPQQAAPHDALGLVFASLKDYDAAVREHETAVRMEPRNSQAWRSYAETLLRAAMPEDARRAAERSLEIEPDSQITIAIWGLARRLLSDAGEEELNDYGELVRVYEIAPPPGYKNIESFNLDLDAWLGRLHRDRRECIDQTLRRGTQTLDNIFGAGHQPIELLRAQINIAVSDYVSRMNQNDDHPLFRRRRSKFTYAASCHLCGLLVVAAARLRFSYQSRAPKGLDQFCLLRRPARCRRASSKQRRMDQVRRTEFRLWPEGPCQADRKTRFRTARSVPLLYVARDAAVSLFAEPHYDRIRRRSAG
jgi:tetratricopeptide (TPR) repeat protein